MELDEEETLNESSKSICNSLDENPNQSKTDMIEADDQDESSKNGSSFTEMIIKENKETNEEAEELYLVKSNLEKQHLLASSFDEEDHENGNAFHIVDENNDDVEIHHVEIHDLEADNLEPKEPNVNSLVCDDVAELKKGFTNLAQKEVVAKKEEGGVEMNSALQRRRSSQVMRKRQRKASKI